MLQVRAHPALFLCGCAGSWLLCRLFPSCCRRGCSLVGVFRLLTVASLVAERGLQGTRPSALWSPGSRVEPQQLWCTGFIVPWHAGSSRTRNGFCCLPSPAQYLAVGCPTDRMSGIRSVPIHLNCVCWFKGEERNSNTPCVPRVQWNERKSNSSVFA